MTGDQGIFTHANNARIRDIAHPHIGGSANMKLGALLRQYHWYSARLAAMPPQEIPHRVVEAAKRLVWRFNSAGWTAFENVSDGTIADLAALRERLARYVVAGSDDAVRASVARIYDGRLRFLGKDWPPINLARHAVLEIPAWFWFYDPMTQNSWPDAATSSFIVDVRSSGNDVGDVKYVWEPNRLQLLHPLAALIAASDDERAQRTALAIISSWGTANPPYRGVNWRSTIEIALRLVSLTLLLAALTPTSLSVEQRTMMRRLIVAHARFLAAFPSLYSSANNHRIAEGLGLFLAGVLMADVAEAPTWRKTGRRILEAEGERQIYSDGVGAEQSPTYQAFSMELLALGARLAQDLNEPLNQKVIERLALGAEFLACVADNNGAVPAIGDDDEGRVIALPSDREDRYVASIIAAVAGLTKRANLAVPHDPHLRDTIFESPRGSSITSDGLRVFERGGVSTVNESINGRQIHLVFDHGPLGLMPLAAHGHADALAIWLTIDGEPVFVDAGTYHYFSGGEVRSGLREGAAHNSLLINEQSPSRVATAFSWKVQANARLVNACRGTAWSVVGAHDGYHKSFGVTHVRAIRRIETGLVIDDQLEGNLGCHSVTLRFLCDPKIAIARDGDAITISGRHGLLCSVTAPEGFAIDVAETVLSPCFGQLVSAWQIMFKGELGDGPATTRITIKKPREEHSRAANDDAVAAAACSDTRGAVWR
jgi:uncharacterized heparinase superfamily protein